MNLSARFQVRERKYRETEYLVIIPDVSRSNLFFYTLGKINTSHFGSREIQPALYALALMILFLSLVDAVRSSPPLSELTPRRSLLH